LLPECLRGTLRKVQLGGEQLRSSVEVVVGLIHGFSEAEKVRTVSINEISYIGQQNKGDEESNGC